MKKRAIEKKGEMRRLKETGEKMWSPSLGVAKVETKREFWERGINCKEKGCQLYILVNTNTQFNTNQRQISTRESNSKELKAPNVTRSRMLGEGDGKLAPMDIWERGSKFGEWEYVYQLFSISKPYFACDLTLMNAYFDKMFHPNFHPVWYGSR